MKVDVSKYFSPKAIVNLSILLGFLVFVSMILFFLGQEIKNKTTQILAQRAEIESRINSISKLAELTTAAKEAEPALAELNSLLPKRDELVAFPRYIGTLALESDVEDRFSFRGEEVPSTETEAGNSGFSLSVAGSYGNILDFLEKLESGRFIIRVDNFDVVLQRDNSWFKADIQGLVFFRD